jgi:hypothetical protein
MCFFSPFEESAVFSYGWLCSQLCNVDLFVFSSLIDSTYFDSYYREYVLSFSIHFFDAVDFVYSSFFFFFDSNFTLVLFLICSCVSIFCFKRSMQKQRTFSYILFNSISSFVYRSMVLSYLG